MCTTTYYTYYSTSKVVDLASWAMLHLWLLASRTNFPILTTTDSTKVVDLASWAMLHLWAGAERTREFVAPLLHMQVGSSLVSSLVSCLVSSLLTRLLVAY